jgi:hypothetical protein
MGDGTTSYASLPYFLDGSGSGSGVIRLTEEEWEALTPEQQASGAYVVDFDEEEGTTNAELAIKMNQIMNKTIPTNGIIAYDVPEGGTIPEGFTTTTIDAIDEINDNLSWYVANGWLPAIPSGDVPANMEDCSWAMLKQLASAGTLGNYYQIGDTKTIELAGGERVVMELVSINDGSGSAGAYYPRGTVDFISKDCLQTTRSMNSSNTNAGGWVSCALRTTLNTTIYETLPQAVKDVLVEKTHKTSAGSQSTSLVEHTDKLWLPTEYEMFGAITYSASTENANVNKHYAVFDTNADRIKHQGTNGSAVGWRESSPRVGNSASFCVVTSDGSANDDGASASLGVPLCFRIGQLYT